MFKITRITNKVLQIQTYKTIIANGYDEIKKGLQISFLCR